MAPRDVGRARDTAEGSWALHMDGVRPWARMGSIPGPEGLLLKQPLPQTRNTLPGLLFPGALLAVSDSGRMSQFHAAPSAQILGSSVFLPTWISLWEDR